MRLIYLRFVLLMFDLIYYFDILFIYRAVKGVVTLGSLMSNLLAGKVQKSSLVTVSASTSNSKQYVWTIYPHILRMVMQWILNYYSRISCPCMLWRHRCTQNKSIELDSHFGGHWKFSEPNYLIVIILSTILKRGLCNLGIPIAINYILCLKISYHNQIIL